MLIAHQRVAESISHRVNMRTLSASIIMFWWVLNLEIPAYADFTGKVVAVIDGDSIKVKHGKRSEEIRLNGIDCPEDGQAYGRKAKQATTKLVFGTEVTVKSFGPDRYGRTVGEVTMPNGNSLNEELVREGLCWWYREYAPDSPKLAQLEREARESKKGLWVQPDPLPPWVFRKAKRGQALDASDLVLLEPDKRSSPSELSQLSPATQERGSTEQAYPIIGNSRSRIYHRPDCPNYSQVTRRNRVKFLTIADAKAAGYRQAKNCP